MDIEETPMNVLKPPISFACGAPSALPAQEKPVPLGKKSGCC
jgi:hypothetical protein